jgi:UDP-N-acetylglucosamine 2-epimerase (non-hydrolysing)
MDKKILLVSGARPNFMKIAPLYHALKNDCSGLTPIIVHTGQHYDSNMSDDFFRDLKLPVPDYCLEVGSGTHAEQTARVMVSIEKVYNSLNPALVVVVGDVNSTLAAALTAVKLHYPVAHVESGLRSYDRRMPEEINRVVTDSVSDLLLAPSRDACENLRKEGIPEDNISFVGNIMIDSLMANIREIEGTTPAVKGPFGIITLHRPSNVDDVQQLGDVCNLIKSVSECVRVVFPMHPRTRHYLQKHSLFEPLTKIRNLTICDPMGYIEFMGWVNRAAFVLTDSGGLQEETTYLGIPCFTLRENTERPVTIDEGTNMLVSYDNAALHVRACIEGRGKKGRIPEGWDGKTAKRIVDVVRMYLDRPCS